MTETLPALLAEIAEVIGRDAAFAIAAAKGGQRVYLPQRLSDDHWLVETIGPERARQLVGALLAGQRGLEFEIPLGPAQGYRAEQRRREGAVAAALAAGATENEAARRAGITGRSVRRTRRRLAERRDQRQGRLL